jgi:hypothetical protein
MDKGKILLSLAILLIIIVGIGVSVFTHNWIWLGLVPVICFCVYCIVGFFILVILRFLCELVDMIVCKK